jgi:hypothetical protein
VIRSWIKNDPRSLCLKVLSTCARTNWSVGGVRPPSNVLYACIIQPLSVHLIHRRPVHSPGLRACLRDVMLAQPIQYWDWIEGSGWGWGAPGGAADNSHDACKRVRTNEFGHWHSQNSRYYIHLWYKLLSVDGEMAMVGGERLRNNIQSHGFEQHAVGLGV